MDPELSCVDRPECSDVPVVILSYQVEFEVFGFGHTMRDRDGDAYLRFYGLE